MMKKIYKELSVSKRVLTLALLLVCAFAVAQKPKEKRVFEKSLEADEQKATQMKGNMEINLNTGFPLAIYQVNFEVPQGSPEAMAQYYLQQNHQKLGIKANELANLKHHATRTSRSGSVVRYRQYSGDYPVNKAEVTIKISPENKVVFVTNSFEVGVDMGSVRPSVSKEQAYQLAYGYLGVSAPVNFYENRLMVYKNTKTTRLAHEVTIGTQNPAGEWKVYVDAQTREIFKVVDGAHYHSDKDKDKDKKKAKATDGPSAQQTRAAAPVDGTGMVFNPDPLSSNQVAYGGGYVDGNDADTPQLTAARFTVTLKDIDFTGGTYYLKGPWAEVVDFEAPTEGVFSQASDVFSFTRNEQGFEAVNGYFHIDFMMRYLNVTLGLNIVPYQYTGGVKFDPHGLNGDDNSYYSSGTGRLAFGEGCVDDAEDSDVIHHELGHGLHDWVTSGGLSQVNGLSEGSGDYVAQSYNRSLGNWSPSDPAYNWVFNWDGHNVCWPGRITNYTAVYPSGLTGQIHTDGQIWSSCMMTVWNQIGQQETDIIFFEGLAMTNSSSNQNVAANAVYQAAIDLGYSQSQLDLIHSSLEACGYTLPAVAPPVASFSANPEILCLDTNTTVSFTDTSSPAATSWLWTFEGGTPATSTSQNPTVTYSAVGTYDVSLSVSNAYGSDEITMTDYISVVTGEDCPDVPDGCLAAPYGQYPSSTFTPSCTGVPQNVTTLAWTGEYSLVNVVAGTQYIFSSSIATDFVTISNMAGTVSYTAGVTPVTWTAPANETIRFYLHLDQDCNSINSGLRNRTVQCGVTPDPGYDCTGTGSIVHDDGTIENGGSGSTSAGVTEVIFVDKFTPTSYPVTIQSVCSSIIGVSGSSPTMPYEIVVYDDDGAGGAPSTLIGSLPSTAVNIPGYTSGMSPVWQSEDTTSENWVVTEGDVYIGIKFVPTDPNHFMAFDQSTSTPSAGGYWWNNLDGDWATIVGDWTGYRSCFIRAELVETMSVGESEFGQFSLFPNPNHGEFTIKLGSASGKDIQIGVFDIRGREIFASVYANTGNFIQTIRLDGAASGMYLVKVNDGVNQTIRKIVVE